MYCYTKVLWLQTKNEVSYYRSSLDPLPEGRRVGVQKSAGRRLFDGKPRDFEGKRIHYLLPVSLISAVLLAGYHLIRSFNNDNFNSSFYPESLIFFISSIFYTEFF